MYRIRLSRSGLNAHGRFAALTLLATGLAACEPATREEVVQDDAAPAATPMPQATPTETVPPEPGAAPAAQEQRVSVRITPDAVEISPATVRPGSVTFQATNSASVPYDLDVDGPGPDGEIENLQPGETRTLTMTLEAGRYEIESNAEQGPERERQTMLTVGG